MLYFLIRKILSTANPLWKWKREKGMKKNFGPVVHLETVDSTNHYARDHFDDLTDGAMVSADSQTSGRGRLGRNWVSPAGCNIYVSVVMKNCSSPFFATAAVGLSALEAIREIAPESGVWLKWPNDLYIGHRKVSGMLSEGVSGGVIAGIGINVNMTRRELDAIASPATSLAAECGRVFDRDAFFEILAGYIWNWYEIYRRNPAEVAAAWRLANGLIGREIVLIENGLETAGVVKGIADDGGLIFESAGVERVVYAGDATVDKRSFKGACNDNNSDGNNQHNQKR